MGASMWHVAHEEQHLWGSDACPGCAPGCNTMHACAAVTPLLCRPQLHCNSSARQAAAALSQLCCTGRSPPTCFMVRIRLRAVKLSRPLVGSSWGGKVWWGSMCKLFRGLGSSWRHHAMHMAAPAETLASQQAASEHSSRAT